MPYTVSVLLYDIAYLDPDIPGLALHGANLITSAFLRQLARDERVEAIEVFMPPMYLAQPAQLAQAAASLLPEDRQGKGVLRLYPLHTIPEVWADGAPRILWTVDPEWMPRERYLRDRFATGPMPISSDTHAFGHHRLWPPLQRLGFAPPVEFDSIVCISKACQVTLRQAFEDFLTVPGAAPPARLDQIPHGVDADLFRPSDAARRSDARRMLNLPEDKQIALCLGRLTPNFKADLLPLLRVFADVAGANDCLVLAGEEGAPGYADRLQQTGAALGLGSRLLIRTAVPPALRPLYYAAADLFVFPADSIQESLANTVLEAMATGLPTVISDWDGMRDLVVHEETGYTVPTWWMPGTDRVDAISPASPLAVDYLMLAQNIWVDTQALGVALHALLDSPDLRQQMGAAGRARVEQCFAWPRVLDRMFVLWDELLALASGETPEDAAGRRDYADRLGLPTPFLRLFHNYASGVIDASRHAVRLSGEGRAIVRGRETLSFYDETLPMLRQPVVDALFARLASNVRDWTPIADLVSSVAAETGAAPEDVRFHIGLLLKRDVLDLDETSP